MYASNHTNDVAQRQHLRDTLQADYEAFIRRKPVTVVPGYPGRPVPPREKIAREPEPPKPSRAKGATRSLKVWPRYFEMEALIRKHGLTPLELSSETGIARQTITSIIKGDYNPRPDRQALIEAAVLRLVAERIADQGQGADPVRRPIARTRGAHIPNGRARLAQMLDDNGITQRQLAKMMGNPESYVSSVLKNKQAVSAARLAEMENVILRIIESRRQAAAKMPMAQMVICGEVE